MRAAVDILYRVSGGGAALSLLALLVLVVVQMVARWTGQTVTGLTELAGYCMGATSFLALGYALSRGAHIRVEIVIAGMGRDRWRAEILAVAIALPIAAIFAYFAIKANFVSWQLGERSQGQDAVLIWIPQLVMSFGTIVLLIALIDRLIGLIRGGDAYIEHDRQPVTEVSDQTVGRF